MAEATVGWLLLWFGTWLLGPTLLAALGWLFLIGASLVTGSSWWDQRGEDAVSLVFGALLASGICIVTSGLLMSGTL